MVNLAKSNSYWLGMAIEGYVFTAIVFWFFCYLLSLYTQSLEKKFSTERKIMNEPIIKLTISK